MTPRRHDSVRRHSVIAIAVALLTAVAAPAPAQPSAPRPFGTLREQAALQQAWLQASASTPSCRGLMRTHGIDMWVVSMREYNEDPVFTPSSRPTPSRRVAAPSTCSSTTARPPGSRRRRVVRRADRARRHVAGRRLRGAARHRGRRRRRRPRPAGRAVGRRPVAGAQGGDRGAQAQGHRHQPLDASSRSPTACRAASSQGMSAALGAHLDVALQGRRGAAARAHRRAAARRRGVLREDDRARLGDDRRRCSRRRRSRRA